eukprot:5507771-Alexandrium_andersonii.AAC.1
MPTGASPRTDPLTALVSETRSAVAHAQQHTVARVRASAGSRERQERLHSDVVPFQGWRWHAV